MLDFYKISDKTPSPEYPEQIDLEYIDGLERKEFEGLQKKGLIPENFSFFSDFRWDNETTNKVHQLIRIKYPEIKTGKCKIIPIIKLFHMTENALDESIGLIAYGD